MPDIRAVAVLAVLVCQALVAAPCPPHYTTPVAMDAYPSPILEAIPADLNGDGAQELVMPSGYPREIYAIFGEAHGEIRPARPLGSGPVDVLHAVLDLDGDGRMDIVVQTGDELAVLLGDGTGRFTRRPLSFTPAAPKPGCSPARSAPLAPSFFALGDLDGDGRLDLVAATRSGLETYRGDGAGGFTRTGETPLPAPTCEVVLADLDGDGRLDALALAPGYSIEFQVVNGKAYVLFGTAPLTFTAPVELSVGLANSQLFAGDFDGDGITDLVIENDSHFHGSFRTVDVLWGSAARQVTLGSGAFIASYNLGTPLLGDVRAADLDGDGRLELVYTTGFLGSTVSLGFRERVPQPPVEVSRLGWLLAIADLNGDGLPDLVQESSCAVKVAFNACAADAYAQTLFVPVIVSSRGANGSFYTTELTLTNHGSSDSVAELVYTATSGGGSGTASLTIPAGRQLLLPDAIQALRGLGLPIDTGSADVGTLRIRFRGLSAPGACSALARTTSPARNGHTGVALSALSQDALLDGPSVIPWLTEGAQDRTNLALANAGDESDGPVVLRVTLVSTDDTHPGRVTLPNVELSPAAFRQLDRVLAASGLGASSAYALIDRVSGHAPFVAFAILNDQGTSDGSVEYAQPAGSVHDVPSVVSGAGYSTELDLTNTNTIPVHAHITLFSSALATPDKAATLEVALEPGQQVRYADLVEVFRPQLAVPDGVTVVGRAMVAAAEIFARTIRTDRDGRYGVAAISRHYDLLWCPSNDFTYWLTGLRQDSAVRTNLALLGPPFGTSPAHVEIYDGDSGRLAGAIDLRLGRNEWKQFDSVLGLFSVKNGYAHVVTEPQSGVSVYAILNDGAAPGLGTGDGTFIAPEPAP